MLKRFRPVWSSVVLAVSLGGLTACGASDAGESKPSDMATAPPVADVKQVGATQLNHSDGWVLLIHGGAGVISRSSMTADKEAAYRQGLEDALEKGAKVLSEGGDATDAVEAAVVSLEDNPLFNAGRGAVLTAARTHELDASFMDGKTKNAGAVAGVKTVRNPISAARAVMEKSKHVMFAGEGAEAFAREQGLEEVENAWFTTERRLQSLDRVLEKQAEKRDKRGTVGAVALDINGNIAAGTSTGGMTAKKPGRVGDSPIVGAGIYAANDSCAVSATGHGEYFIRLGVAHEICSYIKFKGLTPDEAGARVLDDVKELGGDGGVIVLTPAGDSAFVFNTEGMFRGMAAQGRGIETGIYGDED